MAVQGFEPVEDSIEEAEPAVRVVMPAAPPTSYLRYMAYWREIEEKMLACEALADLASAESGPFLEGPVARFISDRLIPSILSQAWDARDRGEATVAPVLEATHEMMRSVLDLMVVRAQWLQGELAGQPRTELIGVQQLEPDLLELRWETVRRLREAVGFEH